MDIVERREVQGCVWSAEAVRSMGCTWNVAGLLREKCCYSWMNAPRRTTTELKVMKELLNKSVNAEGGGGEKGKGSRFKVASKESGRRN